MKLNLKPNDMPSGYHKAIASLQKRYPALTLCGSAALIMADMLPYRQMHDIDFVLNKHDLCDIKEDLYDHTYPRNNPKDKYVSHIFTCYAYGKTLIINLLVFDDDIEIKTETIRYRDLNIKCQRLSDVIKWKQKYNRSKDKKDLEAITTKAFEEAVFTEDK